LSTPLHRVVTLRRSQSEQQSASERDARRGHDYGSIEANILEARNHRGAASQQCHATVRKQQTTDAGSERAPSFPQIAPVLILTRDTQCAANRNSRARPRPAPIADSPRWR
jgi:hypothetical protein